MMLHTSLHPVDAGQGHRDQRRARYAPMNPGAFCHPLRRGRVGIVSPREPYLATLTTARRLISGCGSETLSRLSGFLLFSQPGVPCSHKVLHALLNLAFGPGGIAEQYASTPRGFHAI